MKKMHVHPAFIVALLLAVAGIVLAVRAIFPASHRPAPPPEHRDGAAASDRENESNKPVAKWFSESSLAGQFVTPTPETVDALVQAAADRARSDLSTLEAGAGLDSARGGALVDTFAQILRLQLNPDFEAREEMIAKMGGTTPYLSGADNADAYRAAVISSSTDAAMAPIAPGAVRVRARFVHGREAAGVVGLPSGLTLSTSKMFDIPQDAERGALDVYEVLVPIKLPVAPDDGGRSKDRGAFAIGFGYAWSQDRKAWIPWRIWVYYQSEDSTTYPPNFP